MPISRVFYLTTVCGVIVDKSQIDVQIKVRRSQIEVKVTVVRSQIVR